MGGRETAPPPIVAPRTRVSRRRLRDVFTAYALMTPALVLVVGVLAYPIGWEIWTSFTNLSPLNDAGTAFVGLDNYRWLLADPQFRHAAVVTVVFALATSVVKLGLGLGFALLLARPFRGRTLVFLAVFLPWAYPASVSVIGWFWTLNPPISTAYSVFMGNIKHTVDGTIGTGGWAFISVTLFNVWRGSSFIGIFLLAGLNAVPPELFEYALLESKSAWRRFWFITVPLLRPFLALAAFLSLTTAFADLANVWMLTAGRIVFPVIGTHAYWLAIKGGQFGPASALSLMVVPFLVVILALLFRLFEPAEAEAGRPWREPSVQPRGAI
jgi:multiple sugar transport system permease protein